MSASASPAETPPPVDPELVRQRITDAGFDRVRFARAGRAPDADRLLAWLAAGRAAGMDYLERTLERRLDPGEIVPGARSMIALGVFYDVPTPVDAEGCGRIAAYACGEDYHRVLEKRLIRLCDDLRAEFPARYRWYVDTGPVLERAWATAAGLGWTGKNTCTIDPERGSFLLLAAVITTLELPPDAPLSDHCGTCRRCLDACPTDAFVEPYVLDSRRCISYLTIEHRGAIPASLEPALGNLVFGCDICQDVCPFNGRRTPPGDPALAPRAENVAPRLAELASIPTGAFRERFARSAVRRAKPDGFLRNVIIALGNDASPESHHLLGELAERDDVRADATLRETVERALERAREQLNRT